MSKREAEMDENQTRVENLNFGLNGVWRGEAHFKQAALQTAMKALMSAV